MTAKAWYRLDGNESSSDIGHVLLDDDDVAADVKRKIREEEGMYNISVRKMSLSFHGRKLREDEAVPHGITFGNPLLLSVPIDDDTHTAKKKAKTCFSFDDNGDSLPKPYDVLPPRATKPEFVAPEGWLDSVTDEIIAQMQRSDETEENYSGCGTTQTQTEHDGDQSLVERVAPMAVVRCSRGGKTRALYEIANKIRGYKLDGQDEANIAALYISLNDYSSLWPWEQKNPLQALLRRIVFMASHNGGNKRNTGTFDDFTKKTGHVDEEDFLKWLGDADSSPCFLIVDELNNLNQLSKKNSSAATEFGRFIQRNFISTRNRYFVFSSHEVSTLEFFSFLIDPHPSKGHMPPVILQELPITDTLSKARKLKSNLNSAREAIYYGLLPGLIYEVVVKIIHEIDRWQARYLLPRF